jgi:hypothetical protein
MKQRTRAASARKNEFSEWRQRFIEAVNPCLEPKDVGIPHTEHSFPTSVGGCCQLGTDVKEIMLNRRQYCVELFTSGSLIMGANHTEQSRKLIDRSVGFDSNVVFGDLLPADEPCRSTVADLCVNARDSHLNSPLTAQNFGPFDFVQRPRSVRPMEGRVLKVKLRGAAPDVVSFTLHDIAGKPLDQLWLNNLLDVFALSEREDLDRQLREATDLFVGRIARAMADLPSGGAWTRFVERLAGVSPEAVPASFRAAFAVEVARREVSEEVSGTWDGQEASAFEFGESAGGRHLEVANSPVSIDGRRAVGRSSVEEPKKAKAPKKKAAPRAKKPDPDPAQTKLVRNITLERLDEAGEKGLIEAVLVATVKSRAKESYPNLLPHQILAVLRGMKDSGRVRNSAGRWMRMGRW